jgi:membrane-associated phospholipid phosphatase
MTKLEYLREPRPALWSAPAPSRIDRLFPWWLQILVGVAATIVAYLWIDQRVTAWAILNEPLTEGADVLRVHADTVRELAMLEQYGQWVCSLLVIALVAMLDREGRRKALAIGLGCLATVVACYLMKFAIGRTRPYSADGAWHFHPFGGHGSFYQSFPSAHTTGAMALSAGLAWFYPRARGLFYTLAAITAAQRVFHHAHYVSDTIAATVLAITIVRATLHANLAGRLIDSLPPKVRQWWLQGAEEMAPPPTG